MREKYKNAKTSIAIRGIPTPRPTPTPMAKLLGELVASVGWGGDGEGLGEGLGEELGGGFAGMGGGEGGIDCIVATSSSSSVTLTGRDERLPEKNTKDVRPRALTAEGLAR